MGGGGVEEGDTQLQSSRGLQTCEWILWRRMLLRNVAEWENSEEFPHWVQPLSAPQVGNLGLGWWWLMPGLSL